LFAQFCVAHKNKLDRGCLLKHIGNRSQQIKKAFGLDQPSQEKNGLGRGTPALSVASVVEATGAGVSMTLIYDSTEKPSQQRPHRVDLCAEIL
jgi:hypothetical protein